MKETKKINIYLSKEDKNILDKEYCHKYKVSLSTLAEKLLIAISKNNAFINLEKNNYLNPSKNKTTIKPRTTSYIDLKGQETKIFSNILFLLAKNKLSQIGNKGEIKSYLCNELTKVREDYYNLNAMIRCQARAKTKLKYLEKK